jgi:hypothetical protein
MVMGVTSKLTILYAFSFYHDSFQCLFLQPFVRFNGIMNGISQLKCDFWMCHFQNIKTGFAEDVANIVT